MRGLASPERITTVDNPITITTLAHTELVLLMNVFKPVAMAVTLVGWARLVTLIDDDLTYIAGPRKTWNSSQMIVGVAGFGAWLFASQFWIGWLVCVMATSSSIGCYVHYRNSRVPPSTRWTFQSLLRSGSWEPAQRVWARHTASLHVLDASGNPLDKPTRKNHFAKAHVVFEQLLGHAFAYRCEQILIRTNPKQASVVLQVDGVRYPQPAVEPTTAAQLTAYLKYSAGLNVSDKHHKLSGQLTVMADKNDRHHIIVTTFGSLNGLETTLDLDRRSRPQISIDNLGLLKTQEEQLISALNQSHHVVLVAAAGGHGHTTILGSLLGRHDPNRQKITALENHDDFRIESVNHHRIELDAATTQVKDLLDQKPNVLLLEHLPQSQVAKLLAAAANQVRVYAGVHQVDTFEALQGWIRSVGDARRAADALGAIIAGQLLRRLCTTCRQPYTPQGDMLKKLNLSADRIGHLYRHSGVVHRKHATEPCPDCMGLGYRGRVGVFEVMALDDACRQFIAKHEFDQLRIHLRQQKMLWLQETALARVIEGSTTISELTRVLGRHAGRHATESAAGSSVQTDHMATH